MKACEAAASDERQLMRAAIAAAVVPSLIGSPLVFCNAWLFICTYLNCILEPVYADRSAMAT